ncbi:MAG: hypothetical protein O7F71_02235 [Gammaproteobacteria bacterium]|nr:hypothetical protein [Gammaproteobacteria bacterium]
MPRKTPPRRRWRIKGLSEIEVPPYPSEAIEEIAAILGAQGQAALTDLRSEIEDIATRYLGLKHAFDHAPKAAETRSALGEVLDATDTLLDRLECLDDETRIVFALATSQSKLTPTEAKFGRDKNLVEQGEEEVETAIQHIYNFQAIVSVALDLVAGPKRGRPSVIAFDAFVWMLAHLFERETGQAAKGGPFHDLVHTFAKPLMPIQSRTALGKHVRRALKARPK